MCIKTAILIFAVLKRKRKRPIRQSNEKVKKVKNSIKLSRMKKVKTKMAARAGKMWTIDARIKQPAKLELVEN